MKKIFNHSILFWGNFLFIQWFFTRLAKIVDDKTGKIYKYKLLKPVYPTTGWGTDYKWVFSKKKKVLNNNIIIIDDLVNKFLAWKLPKTVCSDLCVIYNNYPYLRSGTNLLTADEAKQMLEYLLSNN